MRVTVPWRDRRGRLIPIKAVVLPLVFIPGLVLAIRWAAGDLGGRPVDELTHGTGLWTVRFVLITLAVTPLRVLLDWPKLLLVRRMLGLTALAYGLVHLSLFVLDHQFDLVTVAGEIVRRAYLTIGFVALLGLVALGATSTDAAIRRMGRWWKRLHRLIYPIALLAILHYFIQTKANVSEPVFVAGLYVWMMLWRAVPGAWQRRLATLLVLAPVSALAAAGIEYAWYASATKINPLRVLLANETIHYGLRPAHVVLLVTLALPLLVAARRVRFPRIGWPRLGLSRIAWGSAGAARRSGSPAWAPQGANGDGGVPAAGFARIKDHAAGPVGADLRDRGGGAHDRALDRPA